ncbi:glycosyltransferase family 2 protein [Flavobacterium reichenbachii]|uniref:Beta-lactamase regulatory protein n=1 Tax=Flavobacterium reichenbachii TaxID=362418 RepID=A0A085ZRN3_9FLAO|nr:glycosyltransferase [Flavobacterium reichenbachii]KFF07097.1 beta-lactamase regulatory protein [Flavobacterium reichenbachii]OXB13408.1 glycosyl transferase [Flavobacterium reichenbachii]
MSFAIFIILSIYIITIGLLSYGFFKVKKYHKTNLKPKTSFTVIVPFRNEAENLPRLLESFSNLNYPNDLFEVILVDDSSNEKFHIPHFTFQVSQIDNIRRSNSPKKDAISTAMKEVKTDWVITTDADCVVSVNWLLTFDNYIQENNIWMLAGAVTYECENSFLHHFQQLDLISLQGATIGSFGIKKAFMCNGANFAYKKSFFEEINGFENNNNIASGDDVFLLQKAVKLHSNKVLYLKSEEAIVSTKPTQDWKSLFYQRVRWAAKTGSYQSLFGKILGFIVLIGNLDIVFGFVFVIFRIWPWAFLVLLFFLKFITDFVLLYITNKFLTKTPIKSLLLSSLLYPFFSSTVAIYSLFGSYEWKNRRFSK